MRKVLTVVLGLASLGALASAQPAFADKKCAPVNCHMYNGIAGPVYSCEQSCPQTSGGQGAGAPKTIQERKLRRMN